MEFYNKNKYLINYTKHTRQQDAYLKKNKY